MDEIRLFDSERRIMECLWAEGDLSAKALAEQLGETVGWSKTTTYTVIRKCVEKGAVMRLEPGFVCRAAITREQVCAQETDALLERNFGGSADRLVASLLGRKKLSAQEIAGMKDLIRKLGETHVKPD